MVGHSENTGDAWKLFVEAPSKKTRRAAEISMDNALIHIQSGGKKFTLLRSTSDVESHPEEQGGKCVKGHCCKRRVACLVLFKGFVSMLLGCVLFRAPTCAPQPGHVECEAFQAIFRDFKSSHPDFESNRFHGMLSATKDLVQKRLGADGKPVFRGGQTLSNKQNFHQWYNTVPGVNVEVPIKLNMTRTASGILMMDCPNFFPLDGKGFKDETLGHNYWFTMEMHHTFKYKGGERLTFLGDDDFWVFINGSLALDMGGTHHPVKETINVDDLGLLRGQRASFDVFYAERHTTGSALHIETTLEIEQQNHCVIDILIERFNIEKRFICFAKRPWWMFWDSESGRALMQFAETWVANSSKESGRAMTQFATRWAANFSKA